MNPFKIRNRKASSLAIHQRYGRQITPTLNQLFEKIQTVLDMKHILERLVYLLRQLVDMAVKGLAKFVDTVEAVENVGPSAVERVLVGLGHVYLDTRLLFRCEGEVSCTDELIPVGIDLGRGVALQSRQRRLYDCRRAAACSIAVDPSWKFCGPKLYIGVHVSFSLDGVNGVTGWRSGTCINTRPNCPK